MSRTLPAAPSDLDAAALDDLLAPHLADAHVVAVSHDVIGADRGLLASVSRFTLGYDRPTRLPRTLIAKLASPDPDVAARAARTGLYRREVHFYRDLAPQVATRTPDCFAAELADDGRSFVLLLEDVAEVTAIDQVTGCSAAQAAAVVDELALLHARWWTSPELDALDGVPTFGPPQRIANLTQLATVGWPPLRELLAEVVPAHLLRLGDGLTERVADVLADLDRRERTVVHGDARLDNILFPSDGGRPVLLDWQGLTIGPGLVDVGYFAVQSLTTADRRRHLTALLDRYAAVLVEGGVRPPTPAETDHVLRLAAQFSLVVACSVPVLSDTTDARVRALAVAMGERSLTAIADLTERAVP